MVGDNGRFRVSSAMAEYIKVSGLSPQTGKLLLAFIYFQHVEPDFWPTVLFDGETYFTKQKGTSCSNTDGKSEICVNWVLHRPRGIRVSLTLLY